MSSSPSPFVVEPAGWRARFERLLDGVARQRIAVAVVAVLALAAAGALWLNAQPRAADPPPSAASGSGGAGLVLPRAGADGAAQGGDGAASGQPAGATIAVDVVGRVQHPGLVRLPQGSRVLDAIEAASGTAPPGGTGAAGGAGPPGVLLDLNTATAEQLDTLPGVGEVTANQIIAYRTAHPFRSVDDLRQVPGIGDRRFDLLKDLVVVAGVMAGAAVGLRPGWVLATTVAVTVLAAALLRGAHRPAGSRSSPAPSRSPAQGVLALAVLGLAGAGGAGARAAAVHHGVLIGMAARGGTVMVDATVAEEPDTVRYGGRWVVLSVRRVEVAGQAWRTRERVGVILPGTAGTIAVGDRLRVAAGVERSNRTDPLGGEPATVLRRPRVVSRSPSRSWLLRVSEAVRAAARQRALDSLPPERAGLLVGIALGDTSLEPAELDRAFTTAGLTHLTAVSGQNLAVVLAAGLGIAVALRASRPLLAGLGIVLIVLFALLTRWEPSVLRASAMAVLALLGVATGRGPGGRRALCLAVTLLLLANPALV